MIDEGDFTLEFQADASIFRCWDASDCVEFGFEMAEQALESGLRQETEFLIDAVRRCAPRGRCAIDVRGSLLATLIAIAITLEAGGSISNNKRKRYADVVPVQVMAAIDTAAKQALAAPASAGGT